MLVFAHVSSTKTSRAGSSPSGVTRHAARRSAMSGRSCSAAGDVFFEGDAQLVQRRPVRREGTLHSQALAHLGQGGIRVRGHQFYQSRAIELAFTPAAAAPGRDLARLAAALLETAHPHAADVILLGDGSGLQTRVTIRQDALAHGQGIRLHRNTSLCRAPGARGKMKML
jgi:hypothetical protein